MVHFEAQGWRDKENGVPMTKDSIFVLMSMTKPIVSTALMMLFEEGRFLLDDPISNWIPEYENHTVRINRDGVRPLTAPEARPVTVRHVLTHTSGLTLNPQGRGLTQEQIDHVTNHGKGWPTLAERVAHGRGHPGRVPTPATSGSTATPPTTSRCWWRRSPASPSTTSCASASSSRSG